MKHLEIDIQFRKLTRLWNGKVFDTHFVQFKSWSSRTL